MGGIWAWLMFFFALISLLVMVVFQLMALADLEFDYINPYDSASRINNVVMPEFITQGVVCLLFLLAGHWVMSLLCIPYLCYNFKSVYDIILLPDVMEISTFTPSKVPIEVKSRYVRRQHLVDVTEIFNMLSWEKKQRLVKLGYIILLIFMSLFWLIYSALEEDEQSF